ncbi:MAG: hypothetical protein AAF600_18850 [Bacteroidota bacterium]
MEFSTNNQDALDLSNLHRGNQDKKVADKLKCIQLLDQRYSQSFIAKLPDEMDEKTV